MTIYAALRVLHLLFAVIWVGGIFFTYVVLRPSLAAIEPTPRMLLHTQVFRRFFLVVWHAMPIMLLTGVAMVYLGGGMSIQPWPVHAMVTFGVLMSALFLVIFFGPYRQFRRTTNRDRMASTLNTLRRLIAVNLILGLITVIIGGLIGFV
jgi:uncharacterized membrane protein